MPLEWGHRYLMCPPEHYGVLYEINPWMHREVAVDSERAREQWEALVLVLRQAGAEIELLDPQPELPDLVFTANAGLVDGNRFIPARFRHPPRQPETEADVAWFAAHGYDVEPLPEGMFHEGAGDALPFGGGLVAGYRFRSDAAAQFHVSRVVGAPVRVVELADPRLYHLDLTFCPLDERRAMIVPDGWDAYGRRVIEALVPEALVLSLDDGLTFCANAVVVDDIVVMHACPPHVGRQLEAWGFTVAEVAVDEFLKAGGACRCLTLALDVELSREREPVAL